MYACSCGCTVSSGALTNEATGTIRSRLLSGNAGRVNFLSGSLDNRGFVTGLYRNALDREPDRAGLDGWVDLLDGGVARSDVVLGFSESAEHVALTAANIQSDVPGQYGILFA